MAVFAKLTRPILQAMIFESGLRRCQRDTNRKTVELTALFGVNSPAATKHLLPFVLPQEVTEKESSAIVVDW
jgi:hypothetical protein